MRRFYISLIALLVILIGMIKSLNDTLSVEREKVRLDLEMAYFPKGQFLKQMVMGYDALAADLAWLKAIQYYGKHRTGDNIFTWLDHIFNIITDLDPHFINAYIFGALVISEDARQPEAAIQLLQKGIQYNPDSGWLYFKIGFIYFLLQKDFAAAERYFQLAERDPETLDIARRWAAHSAKRSSDFATSWKLWQEIHDAAQDDYTRAIAETSLKHLILEKNIAIYQAAVDSFHAHHGFYPATLKEVWVFEPILADPYNAFYVVDPEKGKVYSSFLLNDRVNRHVNYINDRANQFRNEFGRYPDSIEEMVNAKIATPMPAKPFGSSYFYNPQQGKATPIYVKPQY